VDLEALGIDCERIKGELRIRAAHRQVHSTVDRVADVLRA
jgi:hypothetical protein